jgi:hypothetical protein
VTPRIAVAVLCFALCAPATAEETAAAEAPAQDAPAAYDKDRAHGYLSLGLIAASSTTETPVGDAEASGGGIGVQGAGHSSKVNPSLDIAFRGLIAIMGREFDDTNAEVGDVMYEVDGGIRLADLFLLTLGYSTQVTAYENPDIATTYNVIPVGIGILRTRESGYVLAQLRFGGGRLGNDQNDDTEGVRYAGIRGVVQHGFGSSLQFMLGLGLDRYELDDSDAAEDFVRLEFGLGFGI